MRCPNCNSAEAGSGPFCCMCGARVEQTSVSAGVDTTHNTAVEECLRGQTDQEKAEEERMAKLFGGAPKVAAGKQAAAGAAPAPRSMSSHLPESIAAELIVAEINAARYEPAMFGRRVAATHRDFEGLVQRLKASDGALIARTTHEGARAVDDATAFLTRQLPVQRVVLALGLCDAARDVCIDNGVRGATDGLLKDGTDLLARVKRYGQVNGKVTECLVFGAFDAFDAACLLIVDDGADPALRPNRARLFNPTATAVGVHCCHHTKLGNITSIILAEEFTAGPCQPGGSSQAGPAVSPAPAPVSVDLGVPPGPLSELELGLRGQQVILRHKGTENRWTMPFAFVPHGSSASLGEGGKLFVSLRKAAAAGTTETVVERLQLPADPAAPGASVTLDPVQRQAEVSLECRAGSRAHTVNVKLAHQATGVNLVLEVCHDEVSADASGRQVTTKVMESKVLPLPFAASVSTVRFSASAASIVVTVPSTNPEAEYIVPLK
eukprot:m51a1_g2562 hypothetical protein (494) ;mRNA; f:340698-342828